MSGRRQLSFVFLCIFIAYFSFPSTDAKLLVHPDTPQCLLQGTSLTCKFEGVEESVFMDDLHKGTNGKVTTVYIHKAKKLFVQRPNCVDISLYNVESATFVDNRICEHKKIISLRLVDSEVNQIPRQINRLELTRSKVGKAICDLGLQRLHMTSSQITEFNAPWPIGGYVTIQVIDSIIEKFLALNLESKATLIINNSTIGYMERESLTLGKDATLYVSNSIISSEENSILVKPGAKVVLRDTVGKVGVTGMRGGEDETRRPPGVPAIPTMITPESEDELEAAAKDGMRKEEDPPERTIRSCRTSTPIWPWLIPTVLAMVEAFLLVILYGQKYSHPVIPLKDDYEAVGGRTFNNPNYYNGAYSNNTVQEFYNETQAPTPYVVRRR